MQRLRSSERVIRRRDSLAPFVVDEAEKIEHVGVLTAPFVTVVVVPGVPMTPRVQAEEHDVPDHSYYLDFRDTVVVLEGVRLALLVACWRPQDAGCRASRLPRRDAVRG